jgi:hypothetical protein
MIPGHKHCECNLEFREQLLPAVLASRQGKGELLDHVPGDHDRPGTLLRGDNMQEHINIR